MIPALTEAPDAVVARWDALYDDQPGNSEVVGYHWTDQDRLPAIKANGLGGHPAVAEHEIPVVFAALSREAQERIYDQAGVSPERWLDDTVWDSRKFQEAFYENLSGVWVAWFGRSPEDSEEYGEVCLEVIVEGAYGLQMEDETFGFGLVLDAPIPWEDITICGE